MSDTVNPRSLIQGLQRSDPRLYEAFQYLFDNVDKINDELFPDVANITRQLTPTTPSDITIFTYELLTRSIKFDWNDTTSALQYEIRVGSVWNTADFILRTTSLSASILPPVAGVYTYLIKGISSSGIYSVNAAEVTITLVAPGTVTISPIVIDNNVLLYWTPPVHPFEIIHYHIYREGIEIGTVRSTFFVWFEQLAGTYTYGIQAHDYAENHGAITEIELVVAAPPDYVLEDSYISIFDGTKVNCVEEAGKLIAITVTGESWEDHFINNSWANIQEQIDAGFPIYIEPSETSGSYEEVVDFGVLFSSVIVSINWNENVIDGAVVTVCKIAVSDDDITYTSYVTGATLFTETVRYVKFKFEFSGASNDDISEFSNVTVSLNVKREMDGGTADVFSADAGGTEIEFTKAFKSVESITVTPLATTEQKAVYDFTNVPNPTSFFVYLFNAAGTRINGTVGWKARGIL